MGNLEGSVNGMVRYSIYKLSGNSSRNMFSNEFDCRHFIKQPFNVKKRRPFIYCWGTLCVW